MLTTIPTIPRYQDSERAPSFTPAPRAPEGRAPSSCARAPRAAPPAVGHGSGVPTVRPGTPHAETPSVRRMPPRPRPAPRRDALPRRAPRPAVGHGSGVPTVVPGTPPDRDAGRRPVASHLRPPRSQWSPASLRDAGAAHPLSAFRFPLCRVGSPKHHTMDPDMSTSRLPGVVHQFADIQAPDYFQCKNGV